jgi:uncharacterized protein YqgC (DUF456 family)
MWDALETLAGVVLFLGALGVGWFLTLLSLPGNWLIVASAALYAWLMPAETRWALSWELVGVLAAVAAAGEIAETASAAMAARRLGGSRRGAVLAVFGSIVGALVGSVAVPVPVVGSIVGACFGALVGAMSGEFWKGHGFDHSLRVGQGAFRGRLLGTLAKVLAASVMLAVAVAGVLLR